MGTDTQAEALAAIKPHKATLKQRVLDFIRESGGSTDEEVRIGLGMVIGSALARRNELVREGLVRDNGTRRKSASGRNNIVWEPA